MVPVSVPVAVLVSATDVTELVLGDVVLVLDPLLLDPLLEPLLDDSLGAFGACASTVTVFVGPGTVTVSGGPGTVTVWVGPGTVTVSGGGGVEPSSPAIATPLRPNAPSVTARLTAVPVARMRLCIVFLLLLVG
jgi:hypothetical protein